MRHPIALALVLLCPATLFCQATSLDMLQPNTGIVFGIEWKRLMASPLRDVIAGKFRESAAPLGGDMQAMEDLLFNGIDSVLVAAPVQSLSTPGATPPVLIIGKGRFNPAQIKSWLKTQGKAQIYKSVELLTPPSKATGKADVSILALLDAGTLLGGDETQVKAAIDRVKSGASAGTLLMKTRAVALAASNELWAMVDLPPDAMRNAPPAAAQMLNDVKSMDLGVSLASGFGLRLNLVTASDDSAKALAGLVQGMLGMYAMAQSESPQMAALMKKIQVSAGPNAVNMSLSLDPAEFEKLMKESLTPKASSAAAANPGPGPKPVARVSGLNGGPVKVPLQTAR
ncbi:MAG: hypothetical protein ABIZ80_00670 [Bryobacteraceae bacterium]